MVAIVATWTFAQVARQSEEMAHQSEQINALAEALSAEQEAAENRGETPVAPEPDELIDDPDAVAPTPVGPSDEQVLEAVEAYFRAHPVEDGEDASPAQIAAAVLNYLADHPPAPGEPGPPPTEGQILEAVAVYFAANPPPSGPPGRDGTDGSDGKDAEPLTSERIQAELAAYFEAHPIQRCDPGWEYGVITVLTTGPPTDISTCIPAGSTAD
jgi:hypothetical protein